MDRHEAQTGQRLARVSTTACRRLLWSAGPCFDTDVPLCCSARSWLVGNSSIGGSSSSVSFEALPDLEYMIDRLW